MRQLNTNLLIVLPSVCAFVGNSDETTACARI